MIQKTLICKERVRRIPQGNFSWVDQRIVRDGYLKACTPEALALYLVLIIVGDMRGLSYYSDKSMAAHLKLDNETFLSARATLIRAGLIAYQRPLYQVLALDTEQPARAQSQPTNVTEILQKIVAKGNV